MRLWGIQEWASPCFNVLAARRSTWVCVALKSDLKALFRSPTNCDFNTLLSSRPPSLRDHFLTRPRTRFLWYIVYLRSRRSFFYGQQLMVSH